MNQNMTEFFVNGYPSISTIRGGTNYWKTYQIEVVVKNFKHKNLWSYQPIYLIAGVYIT